MSSAQKLIEKRISEYNSTPLLPLELPYIKQKLRDPDVSAESFKTQFKRDPVFCWLLIRAAWVATKNRANHPVAADHAMSTIGITGTKKEFEQLQPKSQTALSQKELSQNPLSDEVTFCLSTSLLAAELAHRFGELSLGSSNIYWTSLCYQLPDTLLWYLQPKSMWRIYYRRLTLPKKMTLFEESKLGFNLAEWRQAVAEHFHMSEYNRILYSKPLPDNPKELYEYATQGYSEKTPSLKEWHRQEGWLVVLSNRLARTIIAPWHNQSYRHHLQLLHQLLALDIKKLNHLIHQSIATVSQNLTGSKLMIPAMGFLMLRSKPALPEWLTSPTVKKAASINVEKAASTKAPSAQMKLLQLVKKLTSGAGEFESSAALIHEGLKAILTELKFSRASFLVVDRKTATVRTRIALNSVGQAKVRPDFEFKLPTPLSRFVEKQTFMVLSREQHQKIWKKLPYDIQKQQVEKFIFCSLQPGKQVRAIIYMDAQDQSLFEPQNLVRAKTLLKGINKGLSIRNQAKAES
ncbi:hypothetical protein [Aliikangiella coralliicola]|uniref:HDOD domain-containing protein n=1 Tax=Aliikangiella coralliicola TaxID=2592383 RepID=A0A545UDY5_9GAMM|nr:hypothetical protein [Aliikangiella coralliicola]TQV87674.1 hypothetical protein FLL46_09825 [Aliikangiella coralliicola]